MSEISKDFIYTSYPKPSATLQEKKRNKNIPKNLNISTNINNSMPSNLPSPSISPPLLWGGNPILLPSLVNKLQSANPIIIKIASVPQTQYSKNSNVHLNQKLFIVDYGVERRILCEDMFTNKFYTVSCNFKDYSEKQKKFFNISSSDLNPQNISEKLKNKKVGYTFDSFYLTVIEIYKDELCFPAFEISEDQGLLFHIADQLLTKGSGLWKDYYHMFSHSASNVSLNHLNSKKNIVYVFLPEEKQSMSTGKLNGNKLHGRVSNDYLNNQEENENQKNLSHKHKKFNNKSKSSLNLSHIFPSPINTISSDEGYHTNIRRKS